jgi:hypothetical protein
MNSSGTLNSCFINTNLNSNSQLLRARSPAIGAIIAVLNAITYPELRLTRIRNIIHRPLPE